MSLRLNAKVRRELWICLLLAVITLAVYWPVGQMGFFDYDDPDYILVNPPVRNGVTVENVWWALTQCHAGNWHPVTWLSHMLDCQIFGLNPAIFHWENVVIHTVNSLLLFVLFRKMTRTVWRSALVAALFAWHPLHLQSAAWIAERKDLLSGLFMLLTLLAYFRHVERQKQDDAELKSRQAGVAARSETSVPEFPPAHPGFLWLALGFFALGLMSKPMLVTLPAILLLLDFWPLRRIPALTSIPQFKNLKPLLLEKVPFVALSLISAKITFWAQGAGDFIINTRQLPLWERAANAPVFVTLYLEKLFWPANLAIYYPYRNIPFWEQAGCFILLVVLTVLCVVRLRSRPGALIGWLWFLIMLVPVIGLVKAGGQAIADRYTYLPSIGLFVAVIWGMGEVAEWSGRRLAGLAVGASILLLGCLFDTHYQMKFWRNTITLNRHALDVSPQNNAVSYVGLGCALWTETGDLEGAARCFKQALQAEPENAWQMDMTTIQYKLGCVLLRQDQPVEAEAAFEAALATDTNYTEVAYLRKFIGDALSHQGKTNEAEQAYGLAEQLQPADGSLRQQIAASRTLAELRETVKAGPSPELLSQIAGNETSQALDRDALEHYLAALKLKPDSPEILNNLAWLLATSQDGKVRDGNRAVAYARRACELTQYGQIVFLGTLGAAYAEAGKFEEAMAAAKSACDLAAKNGDSDLLQKNQELLRLYRAHQTARE